MAIPAVKKMLGNFAVREVAKVRLSALDLEVSAVLLTFENDVVPTFGDDRRCRTRSCPNVHRYSSSHNVLVAIASARSSSGT